MSSRQVGSGFGHSTAAGVEELFAARLTSDRIRARAALSVLQTEYSNGWCGIDPTTLNRWLTSVAAASGLLPKQVISQPASGLGDLELRLSRGKAWIEVKAQTTKRRFMEITQTDWVRDATDALTFLFHNDPSFAANIPAWAQQPLHARRIYPQLSGWGLADLFLADLALLSSVGQRHSAGVSAPPDLVAFLSRKYLLHVTKEGARLIRLLDVTPAADLLAGGRLQYSVVAGSDSAAVVKVSVNGIPSHGTTQFTYYVANSSSQVLGRHHLHGVSLASAPGIVHG